MFEVFVSHEAEKFYIKQDADTKKRINKCIDNLGIAPLGGTHIKKLHGPLAGKYRYEISGIRVVYTVDTKNKTVEIIAIGGRGDIYKK